MRKIFPCHDVIMSISLNVPPNTLCPHQIVSETWISSRWMQYIIQIRFRISKRQSSKLPVPISQSTWRHFCFRWQSDASLVIFRTFLWKDDYVIHTNHRFWFLPFLFNDWQHAEQPGNSTLYAELSNWYGWKHSEKIEPEYRNYEKKFVIWKCRPFGSFCSVPKVLCGVFAAQVREKLNVILTY